MTGPVKRIAAPLRQQVVEMLRKAIVTFEFHPGERLVEKNLCERFAVSRTVVRESLRQLESEGLVTTVPNRGPVVARLTESDAEQLFEARAVLEALAGRLFARRAKVADRKELTQALKQVKLAFKDGELAAVLAAKDRFYEVLFVGARNDVIHQQVLGVHARISLLRGMSLQAEGRAPHTMRELQAIVRTAVAGDEDAAWVACETHVHSAAAIALAELRKRGLSDPIEVTA